MTELPFSRRHGHVDEREISIREDAPEEFRVGLLNAARKHMDPTDIRGIICPILHKRPNRDNWSNSNVWGEVQDLVQNCQWYKVYDLCEAFYEHFANESYTRFHSSDDAERFTNEINVLFHELGIGWKLEKGLVVSRESEEIESLVKEASEKLEDAGLTTAHKELGEALSDLSRRPDPDITGAVQHCMAALECVARHFSGDEKATLGQILKKRSKELEIPPPIDSALEKLWGYASEQGRHLREGKGPHRDEAQLLLGLTASMINYLAAVHKE